MNLALTSDFPSTANHVVFDFMRQVNPHPRIVWVPPFTEMGHKNFPNAQYLFRINGFSHLEYCDIDQEPNKEQLAHLDQYDCIYLTGGDPIGFQRNINQVGLTKKLITYLRTGRMIVAASGGSMQFTKNVSLFRLLDLTLDEVIESRGEHKALCIVDYEILPHINRFEPPFLEKVRRYSELVDNDVLGLADGAAILHSDTTNYKCVGKAISFHKGVMTPIDSTT